MEFNLISCESLQIIVMLHGSQDYKFVVTEEFGIVSSYAPRTVFGDVQTMVVVSIRSPSQKLNCVIDPGILPWNAVAEHCRTGRINTCQFILICNIA